MRKDYMEWAYETMAIGLVESCRMPGVKNAYSAGEFCCNRYGSMLDAYGRLCERLGVRDADDDVEIMIDAFLDIQREMCYRMYRYGAQFGMGESK